MKIVGQILVGVSFIMVLTASRCSSAAKLANKVNPVVMNRITGAILVILGISMVIVNYGI